MMLMQTNQFHLTVCQKNGWSSQSFSAESIKLELEMLNG